MAKKQVKRWAVKRVAKFDVPAGTDGVDCDNWNLPKPWHRVAITHKGLEALEQAVKRAQNDLP